MEAFTINILSSSHFCEGEHSNEGQPSWPFLCIENPQLGWRFRKASSFEPDIKTPFDLLKHLAVWQLQ
jgi:hypothetical protein